MGISPELMEALGLTLLDSLWQGAIILLLCTLLLTLLRSQAARWRYRLVLLGLLALPVLGVLTFNHHYEPATTVLPEKEEGMALIELSVSGPTAPLVAESPGIIDRWQSWAQLNAHWVVNIWFVGLLLFALRLAGGFYMIRSLRASAFSMSGAYWHEKLAELSQSLEVKLPVQLRESAKVNSPIVIGYLKPIIVFPLGLIQGISTDQVEAILLHELAHIKRQDYLVNLVVSLMQVIYFYHPAYWWLQQQLDAEREYSCDDLVLVRMSHLSLVKALTAVKEFQMNQYAPVMGFAGHKNQLLKRVERIMKKKTRTNWLGALLSMSALLLSFFLMSYQSGSQIIELDVEPLAIDSVKADVRLPFTLDESQLDSLSVNQAVILLLNNKSKNIILEIADDGSLVDVTRNGQQVSQAQLKIFQQAYGKLEAFRKMRQDLEKKLEEAERQVVFTSREKLRWELLEELKELRRTTEEKTAKEEELEKKLMELELTLKEIEVLDVRAKELKELPSYDLDELLKYYPSLIQEVKQGKYDQYVLTDSIMYSIYHGPFNDKIKQFKITVAQLKERMEKLEQNGESLTASEERTAVKKRIEELKLLERELSERQPLSPGKFEFSSNSTSQMMAAEFLASQGNSVDDLLIVVDGEVKEGWVTANLDEIDPSLAIKSVVVTRAGAVKAERFQKWMTDRDALVHITTMPGKKDFVRPSIQQAPPLFEKLSEAEIHERFSKVLLVNIKVDGLVSKGWKSLELSQKAFLIDGKKQSKKLLKKYLNLYEDIAGDPLPKGKSIELQN